MCVERRVASVAHDAERVLIDGLRDFLEWRERRGAVPPLWTTAASTLLEPHDGRHWPLTVLVHGNEEASLCDSLAAVRHMLARMCGSDQTMWQQLVGPLTVPHLDRSQLVGATRARRHVRVSCKARSQFLVACAQFWLIVDVAGARRTRRIAAFYSARCRRRLCGRVGARCRQSFAATHCHLDPAPIRLWTISSCRGLQWALRGVCGHIGATCL